jgi:hypothetical protein
MSIAAECRVTAVSNTEVEDEEGQADASVPVQICGYCAC